MHAHFLARRLGLEHHLLAGERIDALAGLGGRLLHDLHLQQARHGEQTVAAQALLDHAAERIEDASDLLAGEPRVLGDVCQDFRLRRCATLFRHFAVLLENLVGCVARQGCRAKRIGAENSTWAHFGKRFFSLAVAQMPFFTGFPRTHQRGMTSTLVAKSALSACSVEDQRIRMRIAWMAITAHSGDRSTPATEGISRRMGLSTGSHSEVSTDCSGE